MKYIRVMGINIALLLTMISVQGYYNLSLSDDFIDVWKDQQVLPVTIAHTYKDKVLAIKQGLQPIGYWQNAETQQQARTARGMQLLEKQAKSFVFVDKELAELNNGQQLHSVMVPGGNITPQDREIDLLWDDNYLIIKGAGIRITK